MTIANNEDFNNILAEYHILGLMLGEIHKVMKNETINATLTSDEILALGESANKRLDSIESLKNTLIECIDNHFSKPKE